MTILKNYYIVGMPTGIQYLENYQGRVLSGFVPYTWAKEWALTK
jgi:hypothetical protein